MTRRLGFRTRGGPAQGWGNIYRLASFARYCVDAGEVHAVFFAEGPDEVARYLEAQGFEVHMLPEGLTPEREDVLLGEHVGCDLFFAELLEITPERQAVLRRHAEHLVVFDDLCDHTYEADLVVSGQDLPSHANRALSSPRTRFLVGYEYFLCRPEFAPYAALPRTHSERQERVLVTLGGGDYAVGYLKAALALAELADPQLQATFVLGPADHGDLPQRLAAILPEAEILGGVGDLHQRLWDCDLVIGSAGYTKLEAALTQTPCLMMSVQWHQLPLAQVFAERTGTPDLGYMSYVEPTALTAAVRAMAPAAVRAEHARRAREIVDGRGFQRVYEAVFGPLPVGAL